MVQAFCNSFSQGRDLFIREIIPVRGKRHSTLQGKNRPKFRRSDIWQMSPNQRVFSPTSFPQPYQSPRIINHMYLNQSTDTLDPRTATTSHSIFRKSLDFHWITNIISNSTHQSAEPMSPLETQRLNFQIVTALREPLQKKFLGTHKSVDCSVVHLSATI